MDQLRTHHFRTGVRLLLALLSFSLCARALAGRVHLIAPTSYHDDDTSNRPPGQRREGALRLEFEDFDVSEMDQVMQRARPALPDEPPKVLSFYFIKGEPGDRQREIIEGVKEKLRKIYPGADPKIEVRFEDSPLPYLASSLETAIKTVEQASPDDPQVKAMAAALRQAKDEALAKALSYASSGPDPVKQTFWRKFTQPSRMGLFKKTYAGLRGLLIFVPRIVPLAKATFNHLVHWGRAPTPTQMATGLAFASVGAATQVFLNLYPYELGKAFRDHDLPFATTNKFMGLLNKAYTSESGKVIKGGILGLASGVGEAFGEQMLNHLANGVPAPNLKSILLGKNGVGWKAIVSSVIGSWGGKHLDYLRQKGWIKRPVLDLLIRAVGVFDVLTQILESNPLTMKYSILSRAPGVLMNTTAALANHAVSPRSTRWVIMDPMLQHLFKPAELKALKNEALEFTDPRTDIDQIEATDVTTKVSTAPGEVEKKVEQVRKFRPIQRTWLERTVARAAQTVWTPASRVCRRGCACVMKFFRTGAPGSP